MRNWMAVALGLAACATTEAPELSALPLARARMTPDLAAAASGETRIAVRAVDGAGAPVAAACVADGAGFRAEFTAPADLAVPTFGSASGAVRIDCAAGGLRGTRVAQPRTQAANGLAGWPAVGVGVSTGGDTSVSIGGWWGGGWGTGPATYSVRYPAVEVPLE